jgi:ketosteroid isomerase-like protein
MKKRALLRWRMLLGVGVLAALVAPLTATGGRSAKVSTKDDATQRLADLYRIDQIEVKFHRATSKHDLNLMMSLWAPGAVFNIDQQTLTGKAEIRHWFATENKAFRPNHHWESDTPTYKIRTSLNGNKATIYFECHYIDPNTGQVVAAAGVTHTLQKVNGEWLITNSAGSTAKLGP